MNDLEIRERNYIHAKAAEFRSLGYKVQQETPLEFMPDFIADLVVSKGDETTVIAVKSRTALAETPRITELAEILHNKPGWNFQLYWVGEPEQLDAPDSIRPRWGAAAERQLTEAEGVLEDGFPEAAFLLAWAGCQAVLRQLIASEGLDITRVTTGEYILDVGVSHGAISRDDAQRLSELLKVRNAIAHGFHADGFSSEIVSELIAAARRLRTQ